MAKTSFGNPETKAFEKQQLRWATHGDIRVRVHRLVWPLFNRVLMGLDQAGLDMSQVKTSDNDPLKVSFVVGDLGDLVDKITEMIEPASLVYEDGVIRFTGDAEQAESLSAALGVAVDALVDESTDDEPDEAEPVEPERRLGGLIEVGTEGDSVKFVQALIGAPVTGIFSEDDSTLLGLWQERHWVPRTGVFGREDWLTILPKRAIWIRPGATGQHVKTLQAAFIALGFQKGPVTGVWGVRFSHSVRLFQDANRLMKRGRIGLPEWGALFAPVSDSYDADDEGASEATGGSDGTGAPAAAESASEAATEPAGGELVGAGVAPQGDTE